MSLLLQARVGGRVHRRVELAGQDRTAVRGHLQPGAVLLQHRLVADEVRGDGTVARPLARGPRQLGRGDLGGATADRVLGARRAVAADGEPAGDARPVLVRRGDASGVHVLGVEAAEGFGRRLGHSGEDRVAGGHLHDVGLVGELGAVPGEGRCVPRDLDGVAELVTQAGDPRRDAGCQRGHGARGGVRHRAVHGHGGDEDAVARARPCAVVGEGGPVGGDDVVGVLEAVADPNHAGLDAGGERERATTSVEPMGREARRENLLDLLDRGNLSVPSRGGHRGVGPGRLEPFRARHDVPVLETRY